MSFVSPWELDARPRRISLSPAKPKGPPPQPINERPVTAPADSVTGICEATLALTRDQCRWPIGDPRDPQFHYCDKGNGGKPHGYCEAHCNISLKNGTGDK